MHQEGFIFRLKIKGRFNQGFLKMKDNKRIKLIIMCIFLIALANYVSALATSSASLNKTEAEAKAFSCLNSSESTMELMKNENFSIRRVNDSYKEAKNAYETQIVLKEKNKSTDFSKVISLCGEIAKIYENAINARDEFFAFSKYYKSSFEKTANTSSVDVIVAEIKDEIANERYENVQPLIDKAYSEIINIRSSQTTLNLFYETTTNSVKKILIKNWKAIAISLSVVLVLFLIYRIEIKKLLIHRRIKKLELRKKTIRELIMQTQKAYFSFGAISEGAYNIRTKKFAELMRDLDRQIPILQEELAELEKRRKK
jgi:hypothetical protein